MKTIQHQKQYTALSNICLAMVLAGVLAACSKTGNFDVRSTSLSGGNDSSSVVSPPGSDNGGTFTANYKPEALTWESTSHPERTAWSNALYDLVAANFQALNMASDIATFCPTYDSLTRDERINLWADVIAATTYYESSYNPASNSVDVGNQSNKDTWSVGLLQLSVVDQANYGFKYGFTFADLQNPIKNLQLGVAIMARQVSKYGILLIPVGGKGLYWATLHPGGSYDQTANIAKMTKKLSFCQ